MAAFFFTASVLFPVSIAGFIFRAVIAADWANALQQPPKGRQSTLVVSHGAPLPAHAICPIVLRKRARDRAKRAAPMMKRVRKDGHTTSKPAPR